MPEDKETGIVIKNDETVVENTLANQLKTLLPAFNESVKRYLEQSLNVDGEDDIADNMSYHIGVVEHTDQQNLTGEPRRPFALIYKKKTKEVECREMPEDADETLWEDTFTQGQSVEVQVKQTEVNNSIESDRVNGCILIIGGTINKKKEDAAIREKLLLEVVLDLLCKNIMDLNGIVDIQEQLHKIEEAGSVNIMSYYIQRVFKRYSNVPLFSCKECMRLSYEGYEGRDCQARVYVGEKREKIEDKVKGLRNKMILFGPDNILAEIDDKKGEEAEEGRIRYLRKMMEACHQEEQLLTSFDKNDRIELYGIVHREQMKLLGYNTYLQFEGYGTWSLHEAREEILFYTKGQYYYSRSSRINSYGKQLEKLGRRTAEEVEVFKKVIDCLAQQPHGTGMIIADDIKQEAERLCKRKRGTWIENGLDLKVDENRKMLLGITSIDGVLMVDWNGICYAFGVILDGKAKEEGNPARGARYNSLKDYILEGKGRYMVVVSEDGKRVIIE